MPEVPFRAEARLAPLPAVRQTAPDRVVSFDILLDAAKYTLVVLGVVSLLLFMGSTSAAAGEPTEGNEDDRPDR